MTTYLQSQLSTVKEVGQIRVLLERIGIQVNCVARAPRECVWTKPKEGMVKLNTDGALSDTRGGGGGAIRDHKGDVLLAFMTAGGMKSIMFQELKAIYMGLQGCLFIYQMRVLVAYDSLMAIKVFQRQEKPPWYCAEIAAAILEMVRRFNQVVFTHVFREANRTADHLVFLATDRRCN
ncbi:hypothetical protein IFM89_038464 [Coptis chinensis]|uniref:RNase H type-1 domain-containing protein n=1 Tax=Coptis chinensis TaxID=261450 RepID=A0A835LK07_9MAGN|nr:hypothetical protein IFM89_038464 [Coptis chinensis]